MAVKVWEKKDKETKEKRAERDRENESVTRIWWERNGWMDKWMDAGEHKGGNKRRPSVTCQSVFRRFIFHLFAFLSLFTPHILFPSRLFPYRTHSCFSTYLRFSLPHKPSAISCSSTTSYVDGPSLNQNNHILHSSDNSNQQLTQSVYNVLERRTFRARTRPSRSHRASSLHSG